MAEIKVKDGMVFLKNVRLSFPVLFEAQSFNGDPGSKKDFSAAFLISKGTNLAELKAEFQRVAAACWGDKAPKVLETLFRDDRTCLHDGDRKDYDGYEGCYFLRASNDARPLVIDQQRNPVSEADGKVYSGCYVNATVSLWAQNNKYGNRINANLRGVQFAADGEAFAGGVVGSVDEFEVLEAGTAPALDSFGF